MNRSSFLKALALLPFVPDSLGAEEGATITTSPRQPPVGPIHQMVLERLDAAAERWGGRHTISHFDLHSVTLRELEDELDAAHIFPGWKDGFVVVMVDGIRGAPNSSVPEGECRVFGSVTMTRRVRMTPEMVDAMRRYEASPELRRRFERELERITRRMSR